MNIGADKAQLKSLKNETKRLMERERNLHTAGEARLEAIREQQKAQKSALKMQNESELLELHSASEAKVLESINDREAKLARQQEVLQETTELLNQNKAQIQTAKRAELAELKSFQNERYQSEFEKTQDMLDDLNAKGQQNIYELNDQTEETLLKIARDQKTRMDTLAQTGELRAKSKDQEFRRLNAYQEMEFAKIMRQKDFQHQKDVGELERKFLIDRETRTQAFSQQKDFKNAKYDEALRQLDQSFKEKYTALVKNHESVMTNLTERFEKELNQAINSFSARKEVTLARESDSFYAVEKLAPILTEDEQSYTISLKVPEHERDQVILSSDARSLRLSISRRFEERVEGENGAVDKTARTEHHTKTFQVSDILDGKSITQNYQQGILSFNIRKA